METVSETRGKGKGVVKKFLILQSGKTMKNNTHSVLTTTMLIFHYTMCVYEQYT